MNAVIEQNSSWETKSNQILNLLGVQWNLYKSIFLINKECHKQEVVHG